MFALSLSILGTSFINSGLTAQAASLEALTQAMEEWKSLRVDSNEVENWPSGPLVGAQSAIVMEVNTGAILYSKNIHEKLYPASTTKILTCLIAAERCCFHCSL